MGSAVVGTLRVLLEANAANLEATFDKASIKVGDFDRFSKNAIRNLTTTVAQFSGQNIVAEATRMAAAVEKVGGVSSLTAREIARVTSVTNEATAKLRALGAEVPPSIAKLHTEIGTLGTKSTGVAHALGLSSGGLGGALKALGPILPFASIAGLSTALIGMGKRALDAADTIVTLSNKTGLSTERIQQFQFVAGQTGTSVEALAAASFKLGVNIENGTKGAKSGIDALGLSFKEVKALSPEQQFDVVIKALEGVEDVTQRNAIGVSLFGKGFSEVATAVAEGYTRMKDEAIVSTDAQIRALEAAGDAIDRFQRNLAAGFTSAIGNALLAIEAIERGADSLSVAQKAGMFFSSGNYLGELQKIGQGLIDAETQQAAYADALKLMKRHTDTSASALSDYVATLQRVREVVRGLTDDQKANIVAGDKLGDSNEKIAETLDLAGVSAENAEAAVKLYLSSLKDGEKATRDFTRAGKEAESFQIRWSNEQIRFQAEMKKSAEALLKFAESAALKSLTKPGEQVALAERLTKPIVDGLIANTRRQLDAEREASEERKKLALNTYSFQLDQIMRAGEIEKSLLNTKVEGWQRAYAAIDDATSTKMASVVRAYKDHIADINAETLTVGKIFTSVIEGIPSVLQAALTGGGGVGGAIQAIFANLGSQLFGPQGPLGFGAGGLFNSLGNKLTKVFGDAFGMALPAIGAALGALLGPIVGKIGDFFKGLFGVPKEVMLARTELEKFQATLRSTLTDTQKAEAGTEAWKMDVIKVRDAYLATGRTAAEAEAIVRQLWDTDHPDAMRRAMEEINRVLEEEKRLAEEAAEAIRLQEEAFADAKEEAGGLVDQIIDLAASADGLPKSIGPYIDRLLEAGLITEELAGQLRGLRREGEVDWEAMQAAAERYGVDLDSLGGRFQGARLHRSAQEIINDFGLLTRGGADVGGVLLGMSDEIANLVRDSIKFGTTIPANMRPWIQELSRSGRLLDENGNKIENLDKLNFGEELKDEAMIAREGFAGIIAKLDELIARITGPLTAALDNLTKDRTVNIDVDYRFTEPPIPRDDPTRNIPFARGGLVTSATRALIGEAGPELVIPLSRLADVVKTSTGTERSGFSPDMRITTPPIPDVPRGVPYDFSSRMDDRAGNREAGGDRNVTTHNVYPLAIVSSDAPDKTIRDVERHLAEQGISGNSFGLREVLQDMIDTALDRRLPLGV